MMGRQTGDQSQLFYLFNLEQRIPRSHLLRRINPGVTRRRPRVKATTGSIPIVFACVGDPVETGASSGFKTTARPP